MNEMEEKGVNSELITVVKSDAPTKFHISPVTDLTGAPASPVGLEAQPLSQVSMMGLKKKRGRPRKYGPDGPVILALSQKPVSTLGPGPTTVIDFATEKRPKMKPVVTAMAPATTTTTLKPPQSKFETENIGELVSCSGGANFTPHIITVHAGEDVTMKVISFSQQGPRAICILSANGVVSSVTLRQPNSSGGTLTYEGRFEILSLTGSFMPSESGGIKNRSGGLSVSLACPDGRVIGGGVAGLLVASTPVQIVVGSFFPGNQQEQKAKKQKSEYIISGAPTCTVNFSSVGAQDNYGAQQHHHSSGTGYTSFPEDTRNGSADHNNSYHQGQTPKVFS